MEIHVLGSLDVVSSSGARMEIGSAKQRELLALLAAHAPHVVSADRIIDALWGGEGDHRSKVWFHISRLRHALDPDGGEQVIVTEPPGYRLDLDRASLDAQDFAMAVARAEEMAAVDLARAQPEIIETYGARQAGELFRARNTGTTLAHERCLDSYREWGAERPDGMDIIGIRHVADIAAYLCGAGSDYACDIAQNVADDVLGNTTTGTGDDAANDREFATPGDDALARVR